MEQDSFSDFMSFKTLISTSWIRGGYAVGAAGIALGSIMAFFALAKAGLAGFGFMAGLIYFIVGNVIWRMVCESVILFFSMHEQLVTLAKLSGGQSRALSNAVAAGVAPPIAKRESAATDSMQSVPTMVSGAYDKWVGGDADAYHDFVRHLESAFDIMPARITTEFLRNRFRAAAGTPEFESLMAGRD